MDLAGLNERLTRLEDTEAIRTLVATYALGADRHNDPAILGPLFTEDAVWACEGFGQHQGAQEIARALAEIGRTRIRWSLHYMVSPLVERAYDGATARCRWYLWELAQVAEPGDPAPQAHWIGGCYDAQVLKGPRGWRFARVDLQLKLLSPHREGWQTLPPTL